MQRLIGLARLDYVLDADPRLPGDLWRGRGDAGRRGGSLVEALNAHGELLEVAWDADRPAVVAVVALERTGDGGNGVGAERHVARGIEALDGSDQRQAGDLLEVLEWLGAAPVPARQAARERQESVDQGVAVAAAAGAAVFEDELFLGLPSREHGSLPWGKREANPLEARGTDGACSADGNLPCAHQDDTAGASA